MKHHCLIFNCDRRRGNYCCHYCPKKEKCSNPCLNHPEHCKCCTGK